jgi:L-ribulose-5-phosphate 3-epimerase UlaE
LEDDADESFLEFYDEIKVSNLARFDSVKMFFEMNDFSSALSLVSSIVDTNVVEEQLKSVYILLYERLIANEIFSSTDSTFLIEMSDPNLLLYGEAILVPRINLFLEVHDTPLSSGSRIKSNLLTQISSPSLRIYPNPVNEDLTLDVKNIDVGSIEIISMTGEVVKKEILKRSINVKNLSPGIYILVLTSEKEILRERFIIYR